MYKRAGRFLQVLARKSKTQTSRRKRMPVQIALGRRLDGEVEKAARATQNGMQAKPGLVKRRLRTDPAD
jgi:hypothetical protein